ncbi:MAG: hypothetical protein ICV79_22005 [Flavisolibacter sp.]|nr:hypothetical protein [Flavisolibacter sp.]
MHLDKYSVFTDDRHSTYEFLSEGTKVNIKKFVNYQQLNEHVFNLAFGDWDEVQQEIDDNVRTNNKDRDKVLATVACTVMNFMQYHPDAVVFAEGSTPAKTRLYQMGINSHWHPVSSLFEVEGFRNGAWEPFERGKNYEAFAVRAK